MRQMRSVCRHSINQALVQCTIITGNLHIDSRHRKCCNLVTFNLLKELEPVGNTIKIALCALCFGAAFVASDYTAEQNNPGLPIPDEQLSILSDSGCSEITYCADGYTTTDKDRLGNGRDHVYPPKKLTLDQWVLASKSYDSDGYDQFGLSITGNRSDGQSIRHGHIYY